MQPDELYITIGQLIRRRRENRGLPQQKVADEIGLSRASVTNIEAGRQRIFLDQLVAICRVLEIELSDVQSVLAGSVTGDANSSPGDSEAIEKIRIKAKTGSLVFDG
jgi:transcriptional regulator with XRE-family HTH domain